MHVLLDDNKFVPRKKKKEQYFYFYIDLLYLSMPIYRLTINIVLNCVMGWPWLDTKYPSKMLHLLP